MRYSTNSKHYEALRAWIKKQRSHSGMTIRELAKKMDIHHSIIGKIEDGRRKLDVFEFVEICEALEVDPHSGLDIILGSLKNGKSNIY